MTGPHDVVDSERAYAAKPLIIAFLLDAVLVVAFAATGRASHDEDVLTGLWTTAWPFLLALIVGWAVSLAWRAPMAPVRTGLPVWAITVAGGMLLRWASGQGVQPAFVAVASLVLLASLVGWRLVAALIARARRTR
ncbi:MAG TPA: DUF3054 domain-containing protein [Microbacterium sp.]|nr:DUF3054 domain-containing protein [Microbacterium sp.]